MQTVNLDDPGECVMAQSIEVKEKHVWLQNPKKAQDRVDKTEAVLRKLIASAQCIIIIIIKIYVLGHVLRHRHSVTRTIRQCIRESRIRTRSAVHPSRTETVQCVATETI